MVDSLTEECAHQPSRMPIEQQLKSAKELKDRESLAELQWQ